MKEATGYSVLDSGPRDEVLDLLDMWATWMGRGAAARGWDDRVPLLETDAAADSEQLYEAMDEGRAADIGAVVDSLPPSQQAALFRRFDLARVFRYERLDYPATLHLAICNVRVLSAKRGLLSDEYRRRITPVGEVRQE